ncbi:hypothetical protein Moror_12945 [Moniliophthora roreri MCA 2997]|uniref:Uncharacterized protein n=1 Tax=Moniliophthora roreri (strain MCA 2997) TaxID=1381753 RepID=V2XJP2_MONRO|nr:hypothetical protein Moror_12945 [Moniliophthora roreri MCA 2997]
MKPTLLKHMNKLATPFEFEFSMLPISPMYFSDYLYDTLTHSFEYEDTDSEMDNTTKMGKRKACVSSSSDSEDDEDPEQQDN